MARLIEAKNLYFNYSDHPVIQGMDLTISSGEILAIIGPNGSGKTTLLNLLARLLPPEKGQILVKGKPIHSFGCRKLARIMAYLSQSEPEIIPFSAFETVLMGRSPHLGLLGIPGSEDINIVNQSMKKTQVDHLSTRSLSSMSGGERQRVFLAKALCQAPEILFLDEPTTYLDMTRQTAVMDIVRDLAKTQSVGVAAVFHDINLAAMYADTILLMDKGRTVHIGPPNETLTKARLERVYQGKIHVHTSIKTGIVKVWPVPGHLNNE